VAWASSLMGIGPYVYWCHIALVSCSATVMLNAPMTDSKTLKPSLGVAQSSLSVLPSSIL